MKIFISSSFLNCIGGWLQVELWVKQPGVKKLGFFRKKLISSSFVCGKGEFFCVFHYILPDSMFFSFVRFIHLTYLREAGAPVFWLRYIYWEYEIIFSWL